MPVLLSVFAYAGILVLGGYLAVFLGIIGGFLMSLLFAACALVPVPGGDDRAHQRVTWEDFPRSFGVYLWDVVGVSFALWLFWFVATPFLHQMPQGHVAVVCDRAGLVVLLQRRARADLPRALRCSHLLSRSYQFIAANWIEWFPPNLLLLAGIELLWWLPLGSGMVRRRSRAAALLSLFVYFAMVVRGFLFIELDGSRRRSRMFRHKMGR